MSYIGNEPTSVAFLTDTFSGNGSTTAFTLSAAPANTSSILVAISGVLQDPSTYSVSGTTLTFSPAPPTGTGNISVRFLGIPASGVTTTAYRTVTEFTATSGQTTFSVPSYTPGFIDVYRNGVLLGSADYTASNGVSVVLVNGCTAGDLVEVISFQVSSVLNAMPTTGGTFSGNVLFASGNGIWNTGGNVGVGTTTPNKGGVSRAVTLNGTAGNIVEFCVNESRIGWVYGDNNLTALAAGGARRLSLQTNGEERLLIDSSGRVTMPFQPNFFAAWASNSPAYTVGNNPIIYSNVLNNVGSHYNASTGRFTAPVAGSYFFSIKNLQLNTASVIRFYFARNGAILGLGGNLDGTYQSRFDNSNNFQEQQTSIVVYLNASDTVYVCQFAGTNSLDSSGYSTFLGYLIG